VTHHPTKEAQTSLGITDVQTNVDSKSVVVQADESITPEFMLGKLQKVRTVIHVLLECVS